MQLFNAVACHINIETDHKVLFIFYFLIVTVFNYVCVSAFEQGHLDPWRSKSALIIIIIIRYHRNLHFATKIKRSY